MFCHIKDLPGSKGKDFGLDVPCNASSFIFNSKCHFSF